MANRPSADAPAARDELFGDDDAVVRLLRADAPAESTDEDGLTALHAAATGDEPGIVRLPLAVGADPGLPGPDDGDLPLCAAAVWDTRRRYGRCSRRAPIPTGPSCSASPRWSWRCAGAVRRRWRRCWSTGPTPACPAPATSRRWCSPAAAAHLDGAAPDADPEGYAHDSAAGAVRRLRDERLRRRLHGTLPRRP
jgi:hypothetical protein